MAKIKICGLTRIEETEYLNEASVDYAGFVFYEKSKRNLAFEQAKKIMDKLSPTIKKVAVCVSPDVKLLNNIEALGFDIIQIHKVLSEEVLTLAKTPIWYAVNIEDEEDYLKKMEVLDEMPEDLSSKIKAIVVDAPAFGSGRPFNWKKSRRLLKAGAQSPPSKKRDFVLAGGLNPDNVKEGIELFDPDVVDVSSGVEGEIGKDKDKIFAFVNAVRN